MAGKVKVLEVNVDDQGNGGVFSLIKSVIENKPDDLQIDIAALEPFEKKENIRHLKNLGTRIFFVGYKGNKVLKQIGIYKHMCTLLKKERYDVVHIHSDVANKLFVSGLAAKTCGVRHIFLHAHASGMDGTGREIKQKIHFFMRERLKMLRAEYLACSYKAAKWMFPWVKKDSIKIIKNGIKLDDFRYDKRKRKEIRKGLGVKEKDILIGHVGRFMYVKNHEYILDVFKYVSDHAAASGQAGTPRLLLVGTGELLPDIRKKAGDLKIEKNVIFYGLSDNVNELLSAVDVLVMPSFSEGFPMVGIEAQASGVPVIFSDRISKEVRINSNVRFLPIDEDSVSLWGEAVMETDTVSRRDYVDFLHEKGYDIKDMVKELVKLYKG